MITYQAPAPKHDLGDGFIVRRALPQAKQRTIGPFIFLDAMGPATFAPGQGLDVRPHPHIGLATVTYLFSGAIMHRDSLGCVQEIRPGEVNWMTAGRGIVHSERTPESVRQSGGPTHGLQCWVALPAHAEECEPSFQHCPAAEVPVVTAAGAHFHLVAGSYGQHTSPVKALSPLFYLVGTLEAHTHFGFVPPAKSEAGLYLVSGSLSIGAKTVSSGELVVFANDVAQVPLHAETPCTLALLGGENLGPRHLWWNLVSSRPERIEQAKADWQQERFPTVPGEHERIPLPQA